MGVVILGSIGTGQLVREVTETREQVKHNNNKKYSSHNNVILTAAKLRQYRQASHEQDHLRC